MVDDDLTPGQRRFQIILSSVFTVSVSAFFLYLIGATVSMWIDGQLEPAVALGSIAVSAALGWWLGVRPLWNQFTPPPR